MKGRTKWFPIVVKPVRNGVYECIMRISRSTPPFLVKFEWRDDRFNTGWPYSVVTHWRGVTKSEYQKAMK